MSSIAPIGAGLKVRNNEMQPREVILEQKKKEVHYVFCPVMDIDLRQQTWKKMSLLVFPRARICALHTFFYPQRNMTQAKFDNPLSEPHLLPYEKNAFNQASEFKRSYGEYGGVGLGSITGVEMRIVDALEKLLMPNPEKPELYGANALQNWLANEAKEGVAILNDQPELQAVANNLRLELLASVQDSIKASKYWTQKTELEIDHTRATGKGKASLDPLDYTLYGFLGITPRADLTQRQFATQDATLQMQAGINLLLQSNVQHSTLLARVEQLEAQRASVAVEVKEPAKVREMKLCHYCAEDIFKEAIYCKHCKQGQPEAVVGEPETAATDAAPAQPRVGGKFAKKEPEVKKEGESNG